jgi:flagellar protein FlaG
MTSTGPISSIQPDASPVQPTQPVQAPSNASADANSASASAAASAASAPPPPAPPVDEQADLRLVIEDDKAANSYVYVTIDPVTGKVVSQVPREELLKMRESPDYKPGAVFNSTS